MSKNKNAAKINAQQGDVILKRLTALPSGEAKLISKGKLVLAEGETTGHFHGLFEENSELRQYGNTMVLDLKEEATLTHQEHGPITLEPGLWEVGKVQEYDYFVQMKRPVMD